MLSHTIAKAQVQFFGDPMDISNLNTPDGENYLVLNPHSKGMAFTKERRVSGDQKPDYGETFSATFDSTWRRRVYYDLTSVKGMFSPIGFDAVGNEYFSMVRFDRGVYSGKVMKYLVDGGVAEVEIPYFENKSPYQSGCLSKDGRYMILSLESNSSYGVEDLYLLRRNREGGWSTPQNLGAQINSAYQEITPFLASDNKTLFFATNGRGGEGSFDIYYSVRQDEYWRKWSEPVNIGSPVNTSGAETSFSFVDGDEWAYYVSTQNSDGYGDIKRIKFRDDIEEDTAQAEVEVPTPVVNEQVTLKVVDKYTKVTLQSEMISEVRQSSANGLFIVNSLSGEEVEIKSQGYLPKIVELDSSLVAGENEVLMEPISVGSVITLSHVLFHRGTSKMVEGSGKELDLVVEMMNDNPRVKILLKGHTDNQGDPVLNFKLSEDRVKSVRKYLTKHGISAYRIRGLGFGGNAPVASNETEETRKLNRRVEFEVIEN